MIYYKGAGNSPALISFSESCMSQEKKDFLNMLQNLIITLAVVILVFSFFLGVKMAPNEDMEPRISAGDILIYYRIAKTPSVEDVVIFKKNGTDYVGRVIGNPGDEIDIQKENLFINGHAKIETNIYGVTPSYEGFVDYPLTLGQNEYFILADHREGGEDSRYFGPVNKSEIKGTIIGLFRRNAM